MRDAEAITQSVAQGETTARAEIRRSLDRIHELDSSLRAFASFDQDYALGQAKRVDEQGSDGLRDLLRGVPIALKDNISTRAYRTTCGSRLLEDFQPIYNAHVVERLVDAGAVVVGKTNMDEFGMGSSTEHSLFGAARNPWDTDRVCGGSSGGSAAAVSAGLAVCALGSDTGGSIRQPASFCGVVGLKPSYGRVSRFGLVAYGSSYDQVGPITRTVQDAARVLRAIAGHDPRDATSVDLPVPDYLSMLDRPLAGVRVGVSDEFLRDGLADDVRQAVQSAIDLLVRHGATVVGVDLPHMPYAVAAYYVTVMAEASSNLARFDGVRYGRRSVHAEGIDELYTKSRAEGLGREVKRRIILGTYVLSSGYYDEYYLKASKARTLVREDFRKAFEDVDVIACPVSPTTAFMIGERIEDPLKMYLSDVYTVPANLAGICAISVPCGFDRAGLPIGLQLMAGEFCEDTLLSVAHQYQCLTDHHKRVPQGFECDNDE